MSYFLGQVLEVDDDGVKVTYVFVKRQPGSDNLFTFHAKEDVTDVLPCEDSVDTPQKQPTMNNRQQFVVDYKTYKLS